MITDCLIKYYTGINIVENSLIGAGPFILASVEMERLAK